MIFTCPACSERMNCPDHFAGLKFACPTCGQHILIPMPPPPKPNADNKTVLGKIEDDLPDLPITVSPSTLPVRVPDPSGTVSPAPIPIPSRPAPPMVLAVPENEEERPRKKRKKRLRYDDEHDDNRDDDEYDDDDWDDEYDDRVQKVRCPFCRARMVPYYREQISQAGWIVFIVLVLFFIPLCWIGFFMKERTSHCARNAGDTSGTVGYRSWCPRS